MDRIGVYAANCTGIFILLILYCVSRTKTSRKHTEDRLHGFMVFGVMPGCCREMFSCSIGGRLRSGLRGSLEGSPEHRLHLRH